MAIASARTAIGRVFFQRCFYLFVILLVLVAGAPLVEPTTVNRIALNGVNLLIAVAAVAAVGRTAMSFIVALLLAAPTLVFQWLGTHSGTPEQVVLSWGFAAALYAATLSYLVKYVFHRDVMTADKLWGAAAAYLMVGVLWAYFYALVEHFYPLSFAVGGTATDLGIPDFVYFSFTVLTSTGFGDVTPLGRQARSLCVIEQVTGALFVAILIARLAGVYPPRRGEGD